MKSLKIKEKHNGSKKCILHKHLGKNISNNADNPSVKHAGNKQLNNTCELYRTTEYSKQHRTVL